MWHFIIITVTDEMFHFCVSVKVYWNEPLVYHGTLHTECLFCFHVACSNAPQCYRFLLWLPQGVGHGETFNVALCDFKLWEWEVTFMQSKESIKYDIYVYFSILRIHS